MQYKQVPLDNMIPSIVKKKKETLGDTIDNVWNNLEEAEKQCIINFLKAFVGK